jgi:hypothetical protein
MIESADDALRLFERNTKTVEDVLALVERAATRNWRFIRFDGWPSDAVISELRRRGFNVYLSDVLIPDTRVSW